MFYYLFEILEKEFHVNAAHVFHYISFRAGAALVCSLIISMVFGSKIIKFLQKKQMGESIRDLGLEGQVEKAGTPTMGGIIIIACILIPVLLFARIENVYIVLLLISTVGLGLIGFVDDYLKVQKKDKEGLSGKFKIVGQIGVGLIVGLTLYFNDNVVVRDYDDSTAQDINIEVEGQTFDHHAMTEYKQFVDKKSMITTVPFLKNNQFDYSFLSSWTGANLDWIVYTLIVIFIVTAVSNGANITDGIDGLASGTSAIIVITLSILAYVSGHAVFADYLNIMFIPHSGEIVIFTAAFAGGCIGFLWHNSYPARVFMGDTGSLCIGGLIAVICLCIRKELLIPILCGIFLIENLSVILQVSYFKYTKKKYGEGQRIFLMSPLHHHYQKKGMHESKIVTRFLIVGIMLAVVTLATLKLR